MSAMAGRRVLHSWVDESCPSRDNHGFCGCQPDTLPVSPQPDLLFDDVASIILRLVDAMRQQDRLLVELLDVVSKAR